MCTGMRTEVPILFSQLQLECIGVRSCNPQRVMQANWFRHSPVEHLPSIELTHRAASRRDPHRDSGHGIGQAMKIRLRMQQIPR